MEYENNKAKNNIKKCESLLTEMKHIDLEIKKNKFQVERFLDYKYAALSDE